MKMISQYVIAVVTAILLAGVVRAEDTALLTSLLADVEGVPVAAGYVFFDGTYIEPPYRVDSSNGVIFVNGLWGHDATYGSWPPRDWTVPGKPQLPPGITKDSTFEDLRGDAPRRQDYLARTIRHYFLKYPSDEAAKHVAAAIAELPFVLTVSEPTRGGLPNVTVKTSDGRVREMMIGVVNRHRYMNTLTKHQVEAGVEQKRREYECILQKGGALFLVSYQKTRVVLEGRAIAEELPIFLDMATSAATVDEKISQLEQLKVMNASLGPFWRIFIQGFSVPPELAARLAPFGAPSEIRVRRTARLSEEDRRQEEQRQQQEEAYHRYQEKVLRKRARAAGQ